MSADARPPCRIGFHASHEQFAPSRLLELAQRAEAAGFEVLFSSDHFHPWSTRQGQSGFSFAWLAAALQATSLPARSICCPFGRYHPAVVAQAAATLAEMFEGRYALALGSGQALNEHITGQSWPVKSARNEKLAASADIIRALWRGETVSRTDAIAVEDATLFTRPKSTPLLLGAAVTDETAAWLGAWADGLLTTSRPPEDTARIIKAFRFAGGTSKPVYLKVGLSYARTEAEALAQAHAQWGNCAFANSVLTEIRTTAEFDEIGKKVRPEDLREGIRVSADLDQHIRWIQADIAAGFSEIFLHNVGPNQEEFIAAFGRHVLPALNRAR